jgi:ferredoxin
VKLFDEQRSLKRLEEVKEAEELEREEPTCVNCGMCVSVCPYDALKLVNDELSFERNLCTECGLCSDVCPVGVRLPPL